MQVLRAIIAYVGWIEIWLASGLLTFMVVINACEIISRYVYGSSIYWVQETTILLAGWITFLGAGALFKRREYIRFEMFANSLPVSASLSLSLLLNLASIVALLVIAVYGFDLLAFQSGMLNETLQIEDNWYYAPVILGAFSIALSLAVHALEDIFALLGVSKEPKAGTS